jgi:hypothetical protein
MRAGRCSRSSIASGASPTTRRDSHDHSATADPRAQRGAVVDPHCPVDETPNPARQTRTLMPQLNATISPGLWRALLDHAGRAKEPLAHIVSRALADYLQVSHHTPYQVSTATALVEGITGAGLLVKSLEAQGVDRNRSDSSNDAARRHENRLFIPCYSICFSLKLELRPLNSWSGLARRSAIHWSKPVADSR